MTPDFTATLVAIFVINILGWLTPGPNMLVIVSAAASQSRKAGLATALGVGVGGVIWAGLAVSGVSVLFDIFPNMVFALRMMGAGYLLWLGYKSLRSAKESVMTNLNDEHNSSMGLAAFQNGFLVMMTNPKAAIYFGSILTAFVPTNAPLWVLVAIVIFGAVQSTLQHFITASIFSTTRVSAWFQNTQQGIQMLFGSLYTLLGLGVAYDAYKRL